jgi:hypothetical protein
MFKGAESEKSFGSERRQRGPWRSSIGARKSKASLASIAFLKDHDTVGPNSLKVGLDPVFVVFLGLAKLTQYMPCGQPLQNQSRDGHLQGIIIIF